MTFPKVSGLVALAVALAALIVALGALQWRWVREASEAEHVRMQSLLDARATQFAHDFDRELTTIYGWFARTPHRPGDRVRSQAERSAQWFAETVRPQLVKALYLVRARRDAPLRLERFDPAGEVFVGVDWLAELEGLRERLTKSQPQSGAPPQIWRVGPRVDTEIPAVVVSHSYLRWDTGAHGDDPPDPDANVVVTVAVLDPRVIHDAILPELAAKHFPREPGFTFRLQVADDRNHDVVFSAPESVPAEAFRRPDATTSLLRVRNEFLGVPGDRLRYNELPGTSDQKVAEDHQGSAPADSGPPRDPGGRVGRMQIMLSREFATGQTVLVVPDMSPGAPRWTLSLVHAQGSLEAAVTRTRRWNLGVSLGVLALLAASVSLALVASQRAQRLAREHMEFVAGISHELRTPLAVIRSAAENLADGVVDEAAGVKQYGTLIANEGRKLSDMVDQVLTFSTLESGHDLQLQPASVEQIVEHVVGGLVPAAEAVGVRMDVIVDAAVPRVLADPAALGRVVTNLIGNAVKYAASGKWVGVRVSAADEGRAVRIAVADRGPGISHADQKRIFEPFFRGQDAVAAQVHGNGLGLDLVRRITQQHGGRVWVTSEPGHGATFTVELPAMPADELSERTSAEVRHGSRPAASGLK